MFRGCWLAVWFKNFRQWITSFLFHTCYLFFFHQWECFGPSLFPICVYCSLRSVYPKKESHPLQNLNLQSLGLPLSNFLLLLGNPFLGGLNLGRITEWSLVTSPPPCRQVFVLSGQPSFLHLQPAFGVGRGLFGLGPQSTDVNQPPLD